MKNSFENHRIYSMSFASVYPHYITKAEKKGRTKAEVDAVIHWLTGYDEFALKQVIENKTNFQDFFEKAPAMHPNSYLIKGTICGVRIEEIDHELMRNIRYLDKLIDELAQGKKMEKILRGLV